MKKNKLDIKAIKKYLKIKFNDKKFVLVFLLFWVMVLMWITILCTTIHVSNLADSLKSVAEDLIANNPDYAEWTNKGAESLQWFLASQNTQWGNGLSSYWISAIFLFLQIPITIFFGSKLSIYLVAKLKAKKQNNEKTKSKDKKSLKIKKLKISLKKKGA